MEMIPWFAWIAIVAIVVWGAVAIFARKPQQSQTSAVQDDYRRDIDRLERRVEQLEAHLYRGG